MSRRKPRFWSFVHDKGHNRYDSAGGVEIKPEVVSKWNSQEKRRLSRLERRDGKREIQEQQR